MASQPLVLAFEWPRHSFQPMAQAEGNILDELIHHGASSNLASSCIRVDVYDL